MSWIKINRRLLYWQWADNPAMLSLWIHILLRANFEDQQWHGITVPRGSFVTSRKDLAESTGLSEQMVRTGLARLKSTSEITIKLTNKYTILSVCKYDDYQSENLDINQVINQQINQQTTSKPKETKEKESGVKKNKEEKDIQEGKEIDTNVSTKKVSEKVRFADLVQLTQKEYDTLLDEFGEQDTKEIIRKLNDYKLAKGVTYKSDYGAICTWVKRAFREDRERDRKLKPQHKEYRNEDYW